MTKTTAAWMVAIMLAGAAGVAVAQQGGQGRGGRPPECVGGKRVVRTAPAPARALRTCRAPSECVVVDAECCGGCTMPTAAQLRAVRRNAAGAWRRRACGGGIATCPACVAPMNSDVTAVCVRGLCELTVHDAACMPRPPSTGAGDS